MVSFRGKPPKGHVSGTLIFIEFGWKDIRYKLMDLWLPPFQCHFCDKAFMNQAFLQSHIQRRHLEDSHLGKS